jgi:hypothetical protein
MIIAASTGYGGRQADAMRLYLESGARPVVRGAFYSWFGEPCEAVMGTILHSRSTTWHVSAATCPVGSVVR